MTQKELNLSEKQLAEFEQDMEEITFMFNDYLTEMDQLITHQRLLSETIKRFLRTTWRPNKNLQFEISDIMEFKTENEYWIDRNGDDLAYFN